MFKKNRLLMKITVDVVVLLFLASISKRWGATGDIIVGVLFICFVIKWARQFYLTRTICANCDRAVPKKTNYCPYCESDDIVTIGMLKERKKHVKAILHIVEDKDKKDSTLH